MTKQTELVSGVFIAPTSVVEHLDGWKRTFGPSNHRLFAGPSRHPTAVVYTDRTVPRFVRAGERETDENQVDIGACLTLLPLFGPSPVALVMEFSEAVDIEYRHGGFFAGYTEEVAAHYRTTPFEPDFSGFADLYHKFIKLEG